MKKSKSTLLYRILFVTIVWSAGLLFFLFLQHFLDLEKITKIPQSTIIQDRTGKELFRFFEEDRRWLSFEEISPHMIDAIIAVEDQTFRENNGTDRSGLMRAILANIDVRLYGEGQVQWGSTITQQLVKNIYLTKEKTISRKVQELILSQQLTKKRTALFVEQGYTKKEAQQEAKKSLVSAYLNYVFFWNRSYGIDAAARHYFQIQASELTILQSAILAALPQAPSIYNPTVNQESIMWYWTIINQWSWESTLSLNTSGAETIYALLIEKPFTIQNDCLADLMDRASVSSGSLQTIYEQWRKDRVLCRLYETRKITESELIQSFLQARDIIFFKPKYTILAPHFVYRVQQQILALPQFTESNLTYEQLSQWWYTVITTLDSELQTAAEDSLANYTTQLQRLWGNNRALVHIDSTNGDVLSYVWSVDFYNEEIDGQVDVLKSIRQIGSTIKPFFYAYLLTHYPFTIQGNIVDFPIGKDGPENHDGRFRGKTSLATALAWSRNLPVVRIFLALWWAETFVPYLQSLGFTSLDATKKEYRYPLALGADEATLLQLAQAYTQLSTTWTVYPMITPIQRIVWPDGVVVYEKPTSRYKKVIPDTVGEMIWRILENQSNMPTDWRRLHNMALKQFALKTGTSDIKIGGEPRPRDGISVVYTPTDVIINRAGNTDGSAMWPKAFGGEMNHYSLREYVQKIVSLEKIQDQPRITNTSYTTGGWYAGIDHQELTREQEQLLWRGNR